ncbi:MAG: TIGR01212 family radical SAM protein [Lachnospiraceae bacterium]|nr:TIGR01212 family radical SAM protein [Lachnospiraceae bacterium]
MKLLNEYLREKFGCKVYKVSLNGGFTCPNRDGTLDTRGCIFCSQGGSGEFASDPSLDITRQIEEGKKRVRSKTGDGKYIAYFQAYTGTYGDVETLRRLYTQALSHPEVVALSIATRPDCLSYEVLELLSKLNKIKPVWVELGLQTVNEKTAVYIRRDYELAVFDDAMERLKRAGIETIVHVIIGLPGEGLDDYIRTVKYVCDHGASGIKLQLLHILKGTDLEKEYLQGRVRVLSEDEYIEILRECVKYIPDNVVIHRLTGDGDKKILVAPLWSGNKKRVLNRIKREILNL